MAYRASLAKGVKAAVLKYNSDLLLYGFAMHTCHCAFSRTLVILLPRVFKQLDGELIRACGKPISARVTTTFITFCAKHNFFKWGFNQGNSLGSIQLYDNAVRFILQGSGRDWT